MKLEDDNPSKDYNNYDSYDPEDLGSVTNRLSRLKKLCYGSADRLSEYDEFNSELHEGSYSGVEGYHIWVISDQIKKICCGV